MADLDILHIAETLDRHGVEYVLVGAASAIAQGWQGGTQDYDTVISIDTENLERLAAALRELGAALRVTPEFPGEASVVGVPITPSLLRSGQTQWYTPHGDVDILAFIDGPEGHRDFEYLAEGARTIETGDAIRIRVARLDDVIASKEAAGRAKDEEALESLRSFNARLKAIEDLDASARPDIERSGPDLEL